MKNIRMPVYLIIFQVMLVQFVISTACGLSQFTESDTQESSTPTFVETQIIWYGIVLADVAPLRQLPEVDSEKTGELIKDQPVTVTRVAVNSEGNWLFVSATKANGDNLEGWVKLEFIGLDTNAIKVTDTLEFTRTMTPSTTPEVTSITSTPSKTLTPPLPPTKAPPTATNTTTAFPPPPTTKAPPIATNTKTASPPPPPTAEPPTPTNTKESQASPVPDTPPPPPTEEPPTPTDTKEPQASPVPDTPEPTTPIIIITLPSLITIVPPLP